MYGPEGLHIFLQYLESDQVLAVAVRHRIVRAFQLCKVRITHPLLWQHQKFQLASTISTLASSSLFKHVVFMRHLLSIILDVQHP